MNRTTVLLAAVVLVTVGGCSTAPASTSAQPKDAAATSVDDGAPASAPDTAQPAPNAPLPNPDITPYGRYVDPQAQQACQGFWGTQADAASSNATDALILEGLWHVYDTAMASSDAALMTASGKMVDAFGVFDRPAYSAAEKEFVAACQALS